MFQRPKFTWQHFFFKQTKGLCLWKNTVRKAILRFPFTEKKIENPEKKAVKKPLRTLTTRFLRGLWNEITTTPTGLDGGCQLLAMKYFSEKVNIFVHFIDSIFNYELIQIWRICKTFFLANEWHIYGFQSDVIRFQSQKSDVLRILIFTRLKINRKYIFVQVFRPEARFISKIQQCELPSFHSAWHQNRHCAVSLKKVSPLDFQQFNHFKSYIHYASS